MQKKISKNFILILAGSLLLIAGCSKSGSTTPPTKTKSDYIASSSWKYSQAGIDGDGNGTIDQPAPSSLVMPCLTDNTITFKSDKSGSIDEGASKCDAATPQVAPFTWALNSSDTLTLSTPLLTGFGNSAKVREVTDSRLVLSNTISYSGFPVPIVVILVH